MLHNLRETFEYNQFNRLTQSQVRYNNADQTAQVVSYDVIGNITGKTGVHSKYQYGDSGAGPHALTSNGGCKTYAYDANGNQTSFRNCENTEYSLQYSTFDKATVVTRKDHKSEFAYGPDRARYKRIDHIKQAGRFEKRKTTWYLGSVELIDHHTSIGTVSKREYRRNMGGVIQTISYSTTTSTTPTGHSTHYLHTNHLGSTDVITDNQGRVAQTMSFDAWGKRRSTISWEEYSSTTSFTQAALPSSSTLPRDDTHTAITNLGYTGHEMIDGAGFVHMNGRLYDPHTGRFLQADPFVESPYGDPQTLNRYSYVRNNPLNATDPTGFFSVRFSLSKLWKIIGTIGIIALTAFLVTTSFGAAFPLLVGAIGGFLSGYLSTGTLEGAFVGAVIGAFSTGAFTAVAKAGLNLFTGALVKGAINGFFTVLQGGKFGHGFVSTFASTVAAPTFISGGGASKIVARTVYASVIGGTISDRTGGKFANGAVTSAFAHLFNTESAVIKARNVLKLWPLDKDSLIQKWKEGGVGDGRYGTPRSDGRTHNGIDVLATEGTEILAPADGIITWGYEEKSGNFVKIKHGDTGVETSYSHLIRPENYDQLIADQLIRTEKTGFKVVRAYAGKPIGLVGRTGNPTPASGTHVHLVIRVNSITIDPRAVFNYRFEGDKP